MNQYSEHEIPQKLNGRPVVASARIPLAEGTRPGCVVLCKCEGAVQPWVTAVHCFGDEGWFWGHYFFEEAQAREDFMKRMQLGC